MAAPKNGIHAEVEGAAEAFNGMKEVARFGKKLR